MDFSFYDLDISSATNAVVSTDKNPWIAAADIYKKG